MSDPAAEADVKLVEEHLPLIRKLAVQLAHELDLQGWVDDLVGAGKEGLLEARQRFDAARGVKLTTFAFYRIRGAMIDAIRKGGYTTVSQLRKLRLLQMADETLEGVADAPAGQHLAPDAAAAAIEQALTRMSAAFIVDAIGQGGNDVPEAADVLLEKAQTRAQVRKVLDRLPERERAVLEAHYVEGRRFDELAAQWGISKAWMSRLHWRALDLLKEGLDELGVTGPYG